MVDPARKQCERILVWDLLRVCGLAGAALGLGILANLVRAEPLPWQYEDPQARVLAVATQISQNATASPPPQTAAEVPLPEVLDLARFKEFVESGEGLILDVRDPLFYRLGRVPGALSLPRSAFQEGYERIRSHLTESGIWTVVYCSNVTCKDAGMVRNGLVAAGHSRVAIYAGGWDEWKAAGLPVESDR